MPGHVPVLFTHNLFSEVKEIYKQITERGLELLRESDKEDTDYMKLRIIQEYKIWVNANAEGVTFMKPEDY